MVAFARAPWKIPGDVNISGLMNAVAYHIIQIQLLPKLKSDKENQTQRINMKPINIYVDLL